jgi:hypothetical protein
MYLLIIVLLEPVYVLHFNVYVSYQPSFHCSIPAHTVQRNVCGACLVT